jgi:protein-S-isoprenylcysteine O-methyltransferase Ste14
MSDVPAFTPNAFQKILPPVWMFGVMMVMVVLHEMVPTPLVALGQLKLLGWTIFAGALVMAWRAKKRFDIAETPVKPFTESTIVVEAGLFRYSRNPMYLAMLFGLTGFALAIGDALPFIVIPVYFILITTQFIAHEEQLMEARFGQSYLEYKSRVRRWL